MASESTNLVKVTYVKSAIGYSQRQKDTVKSLGLKHLGDSAVHADSPPIRGMLRAVNHLVSAEPIGQVDVVLESGS
ncbi:MAG: 50S ribosomal protein L30 [Anaerolineae bacterium]|jgi:large subunit ribosomal protein L30|nr:50S ribosomal protein L30 [Ardenticatenia bacterium]HQZ71338.1 50S ribosomal protein L30 [Anaerolineae bacterium]HRA19633.1 50S ribosomal protein L30 [Anaerolineae bacterium]